MLIVSRNLDTQDLYVQVLRAERMPAFGVSTCEEMLVLVHQIDISAVLFDVERPDDWQSVAAVRTRLLPAVPLVVLTGWLRSDGGNRLLAQSLGCAGFLAKPVPPSVMVDALQRAARGCPWTEYAGPV